MSLPSSIPRPTPSSRRLTLEAGPASLALSSDGRRAFVTHPEAQKISVVDLAQLTVLEVLPHPGTPFGIATDTRGRLYISDWNRDVLSYVDGTLHDRAGEIVIGRSPAGVALSPDGKLAFAANRESDTVSIVTTNDWTLAATVPVGRAPFALAVSPGRLARLRRQRAGRNPVRDRRQAPRDHRHHQGRRDALRRGTHRRRLEDTSSPTSSPAPSRSSTESAGGSSPPSRSAATRRASRSCPDESKAYVANWFSGYVSVIDIASAREVKRIACGAGPRAMALAAGVP